MDDKDLDRRLRRLRVRGRSHEEIAEAVGRPVAWVAERLDTLWREASDRGRTLPPTPQEIAERAAECRALWSEHDYMVRSGRRSACKRPDRDDEGWTPPVVSLREISVGSS
jgi:hypothetical protein